MAFIALSIFQFHLFVLSTRLNDISWSCSDFKHTLIIKWEKIAALIFLAQSNPGSVCGLHILNNKLVIWDLHFGVDAAHVLIVVVEMGFHAFTSEIEKGFFGMQIYFELSNRILQIIFAVEQ